MADSTIARPGAELAYDEQGTGPVLGYAHGIMVSRAAEDALDVLDWAPLTARRRLVRYDARAHGRSTGEPDEKQYRWPHLAEDLLALADHVGGDEPIDWAGQSMGTGTLLWAAVRAPGRFRRLVLMIPPTTGATRTGAATLYRAGADVVEQQGKAAWVAELRKFPAPEIFAGLPSYRFDVDIAEPLMPSVLRGAAASDLPPAEALARITVPALILSWTTDPIHPVSSAEYLRQILPGARLHVSSTAGDVRGWPARIAEFLEN